eukprot:XP_011450359.1 PREDICTED: atrial natriuretic peptide receptor 3 [Crassostrea gigas]
MSLLCFLAFIFLPVVKCFTEVQMALMVPNDTHRLFSVDIVLPAVNIGILRARSFLPSDVNFTVHYADSKCHIGVGINEAIKLWYAGKVHVFFGPVCDYAVAPVARQTRFWNIPIVSVGAMAAEFKKFHVEDYPTLTRAGAVDFTVFSALIHKFLDQFKWNKFKILYEQQGINVSDDFCKIMSSSIYYTPSNKRKDYFNLGDLGDLENIIISEIGIGYGGMYIVWLEFINGKRDTTLIPPPLQPHILVDLLFFFFGDRPHFPK